MTPAPARVTVTPLGQYWRDGVRLCLSYARAARQRGDRTEAAIQRRFAALYRRNALRESVKLTP